MRLSALLLLLLPAGFAVASGPWRPFEEAAPGMVPKLEALAAWCATVKLNRERSEVHEAILAFDPDHRAARRALRYSRDRDGGWVRRGKYRRPRTTKAESRPEFLIRREKLVRKFVDEVLAGLVERRAEVTGPTRQRMLDGLAALLPEDEGIRKARGEVFSGSAWILRETSAARTRMPALSKRAREIYTTRKKAENCAFDGTDRAIGLPLTVAVRNAKGRVTGTVEREEITDAARLASAAVDFFAETLEPGAPLGSGYRIYLLGDNAAKRAFLQRHPKMTPEARAFLTPLNSGWVPGLDHLGIWAESRSLRFEWASRQTISLLGLRKYWITTRHGALHEGIGLYLSYLLTGERRTWFVQRSAYAEEGTKAQPKLEDKTTDWLAVARSLVAGGERPDYPWLLGLGVNDMKWKELVHSYVLGVYLVAGDAPGRGAFLRKVGTGTSPSDAALGTLGHTLPELEQRVLRWLAELPQK